MKDLKVAKVEPFVLTCKLDEPFYFSQFEYLERKICIVKITLNDGTIGWGEGYGPGSLVKAGIYHLAQIVIGRDPLQIENIWQDMFRFSYDYSRKGILLSALSAIDIALWDIKGKILEQPVSVLLGGRKRESAKVYATGLYFTNGSNQVEKLQKEAKLYKESGFEAIKMKIGLGIDTDITNIRAVRKAIGDDLGLMMDANHAFSLCEARQLMERAYEFNITWFEEPVVNEDYEGYAELRRLGKIPIAGGECESLKYGALEMISKKCVDIFQPDTCACGGITELKKIMAIAQAFNINLTPHNWGTGIATAANLQIVSNIDVSPTRLVFNEPLLEFDCSSNRIRDELLIKNFTPVNGRLTIPADYGLGIEVFEEKLEVFLVEA